MAGAAIDLFMQLGAASPLAPACDHFYFLRHGRTARNALRIFQAPDEPLDDTGHAQAAQAARLLAAEPLRHIVCSDAMRAHQTALAVAAPHGLTPQARSALRERNFGCLIGTSSAEIDWGCAPEGGETLAEFMARKRDALHDALAQQGPVLIVAHGGSLYALCAMLGLPLDLQLLGNAQPLRVARGPQGAWRVEALAPSVGVEPGAALA